MTKEFEELLEEVLSSPMENDVLRYGTYLSDTEKEVNGVFIRLRMIRYEDKIYKHIMKNGVCTTFCECFESADVDIDTMK